MEVKGCRAHVENGQEGRQIVPTSSVQFVRETFLPDHLCHRVTLKYNNNDDDNKDKGTNNALFSFKYLRDETLVCKI